MPVYFPLADLVVPSLDRVVRGHDLSRRAGPYVPAILRGSVRDLGWEEIGFESFAHFCRRQTHLLRRGALGEHPEHLRTEHHAFHINEVSLGLAMADEYPLAALHWLGPPPAGSLQVNPKFGGLDYSGVNEAFIFEPAEPDANFDQFEHHPRFVSLTATEGDRELAELALLEEGNVSLRYHQGLGAITTLVFQGVIRSTAPERDAPFRFVTTDHGGDNVLQRYAQQVARAFCNAPSDFAAYTDHQQVAPLLATLDLFDDIGL